MRNFREPTAKNLLREPLVLGVPFIVIIGLTIFTLSGLIIFGDTSRGGLSISIAVICIYAIARGVQFFAKPGWTESLIFLFERNSLRKRTRSKAQSLRVGETNEIYPVETLELEDLIAHKTPLQERISRLKIENRITVLTSRSALGLVSKIYSTKDVKDLGGLGLELFPKFNEWTFAYSLHQLPTVTTPLWLYEILSRFEENFLVVSIFKGLSAQRIKEQIETARRRNSRISTVSNVDSDIAFDEATQVLEGIARGDDSVVSSSVVVFSKQKLDLDSRYFCAEKYIELSRFATSGLRVRPHRTHIVRSVTASDLILNFGDPQEEGSTPILKTTRGLPLYFNPQDSRLEALHWLVTAASGAGKSFFVGLVLLRLIREGNRISVLFLDHNRSFRRVVRGAKCGEYIEPSSFKELSLNHGSIIQSLGTPGTLAGVELSDLAVDEKRAAIRILLMEVESWLRKRSTTHPVYLVLDECWNFMRDEPLLVQRMFREFRKLNGAAIAITQSLSDFLMDESGRAIFQNAPIRILLRQGEDLEPYRGVLGLNNVELKKLRALRQKKGEFSECLIKTPFLSRIGRLYPTEEEHELLRTDNIREEIVRENMRHQDLALTREARC